MDEPCVRGRAQTKKRRLRTALSGRSRGWERWEEGRINGEKGSLNTHKGTTRTRDIRRKLGKTEKVHLLKKGSDSRAFFGIERRDGPHEKGTCSFLFPLSVSSSPVLSPSFLPSLPPPPPSPSPPPPSPPPPPLAIACLPSPFVVARTLPQSDLSRISRSYHKAPRGTVGSPASIIPAILFPMRETTYIYAPQTTLSRAYAWAGDTFLFARRVITNPC
jgi:hypothetical protein